MTWFEAAAYCNWLSKKEGIDKDHWCYETNANDQVTDLKKNYLSLTGYRLPTEAEMEYSTRAGALTSRYYGETEELLGKYGWYLYTAQDQTWPVGSLKPNDFGLFDLYGNLNTWCQGPYDAYPDTQGGEAVEDHGNISITINTGSRVLRGGSFLNQASTMRSACRFNLVPSWRSTSMGFRPSRTLLLGKAGSEPNLVTMKSGLQYLDRIVGSGKQAKLGDTITVHFTVTDKDGKKIESTYDKGLPQVFRLGNAVPEGCNEGIVDMREGGKRKLIIPAGVGRVTSSKELHFEIELLKVVPAKAQP